LRLEVIIIYDFARKGLDPWGHRKWLEKNYDSIKFGEKLSDKLTRDRWHPPEEISRGKII